METEKREKEGEREAVASSRNVHLRMPHECTVALKKKKKDIKKIEAGDSDRIHRSEQTWHIAGKDLWLGGRWLISEQEFSWHEGGSHLAPVTSPWQPCCTLNLVQPRLCFRFKLAVKCCLSRIPDLATSHKRKKEKTPREKCLFLLEPFLNIAIFKIN